MHEASIIESLLDTVSARTPLEAKVQRIHVRIGGLTAVSPDAMQFYFDILREEHIGRQAELTIECLPLQAWCEQCQHEWTLPEPKWSCPQCGSAQLTYKNGNELDLVAIEVEDA